MKQHYNYSLKDHQQRFLSVCIDLRQCFLYLNFTNEHFYIHISTIRFNITINFIKGMQDFFQAIFSKAMQHILNMGDELLCILNLNRRPLHICTAAHNSILHDNPVFIFYANTINLFLQN